MIHPPFSSWDEDGRAIGIEVELIAEAGRRLGREVEWVERRFAELLPAVAAGEADFAASTLGITEERARLVLFSESYYQTSIVALARIGDGGPKTLAELRGRRIGTERTTTAEPAAKARIPEALRVLTPTEGLTWAQMLAGGHVDAVVLDESHAEKFMLDAGQRFHVIEEPLQEELFAIALNLEAEELRTVLNEVIADRRARMR
jgi:polar amino acid transport system substrate-binding protein